MKNSIWFILLTFILVPSGMNGQALNPGEPIFESITKSLDFGNVLIGEEYTLPVKIKNVGSSSGYIWVHSIEFDSTVFVAINGFSSSEPLRIESGETKEILIKFKPIALKEYKSELTIMSDAYEEDMAPIVIKGNAIDDPIIAASWDFGTVDLNRVFNRYINIYNISSQDITIDSLYYEKGIKEYNWNNFPDFNYPITVPAGKIYPIFIQFEASEEGYFQEGIIIKSTPPTKQTCQVRGTAIDINTSVLDITEIESLSFQSIDGGSDITFSIVSERVIEAGAFAIYSQEGKLIKSIIVSGNSSEISVSISKSELPRLALIRLTQGEKAYVHKFMRE